MPRGMYERPLIGAQTLLGKLIRERADLDAAIRVLTRYDRAPATARAAVNGHAPVTGSPTALKPGSREADVYAALTDTPQDRHALVAAVKVKATKDSDAAQIISNILTALRKKRLATKTPHGWVKG
jgi:hypothetical protein